MISLRKKPGLMCSAFFVLSAAYLTPAEARVDCYALDESLSVSRNDVATGGGGAQKSFAIPGSQSSLIINGNVDLNIESDIAGFAHGIVTKQTEFVWQVDVYFEGNSNDFITADYQFNGLNLGDNRICSSPTSCIDVTSVNRLNSQRQVLTFWGFRVGIRTRESIQLTLDLTNARDSGVYNGNLQVELFRGSDPNGGDRRNLTCNN